MLRVASFKITDDIGINRLLENYRIAEGAQILISDGHVCIPFEDGAPMTNSQRAVMLKEQKNKVIQQIDIIEHSQGVVDLQIADAQSAFDVAEQEWKQATSDKRLEANKRQKEDALIAAQNMKLQNEHELTRFKRNIELFDETIASLSTAGTGTVVGK
jgi:hypothetical protein